MRMAFLAAGPTSIQAKVVGDEFAPLVDARRSPVGSARARRRSRLPSFGQTKTQGHVALWSEREYQNEIDDRGNDDCGRIAGNHGGAGAAKRRGNGSRYQRAERAAEAASVRGVLQRARHD